MSQDNFFGVACKTCRRRGRKCDRRLPRCANCGLRGLECEGYVLRWIDGANKKSSNKGGRSHRVHDSNGLPQRAPDHFSNVNLRKHPQEDQIDSETASAALVGPGPLHVQPDETYKPEAVVCKKFSSWGQAHAPFSLRSLPSNDMESLANYYTEVISPAFTLGSETQLSPYNQQVRFMIGTVASLRCAVAATASCHLAQRLFMPSMTHRSLYFRMRAVELLRQELEAGTDYARLYCAVILAQLDVCSGGCYEFEVHLKAAAALLSEHDIVDNQRTLIALRLAWLDVIDASTSQRMPYIPFDDLQQLLSKIKSPAGTGQDSLYCHVDLFSYLAEAILIFQFRSSNRNNTSRATTISYAVQRWENRAPEIERQYLNEVWRYGILCYLLRTFNLPGAAFPKRDFIRRIFHFSCRILPGTSWSFAMSWPLYQAGLLLSPGDSDEKIWLTDHLRSQFSALGCVHQNAAADILEKVWQQPTSIRPVPLPHHVILY